MAAAAAVALYDFPLPAATRPGVGRLDLAQPRRDPLGRSGASGVGGTASAAWPLCTLAGTPMRIKNVANVCTTSLERASVQKRISATVGLGGGMTLQRDPRAGGGRPTAHLQRSHLANSSIFTAHARAAAAGEGRRAGDGRHTGRRLSHGRRACGGRRHPRQSRPGWRGRRSRRPTPEPPSGAREGGVGDPRQSRRSGRGRCRRATDARAGDPGEEKAGGDRRQRARRASGGGR